MMAFLYLLVCFISGIGIKTFFHIDTKNIFRMISGEDTSLSDYPPAWTFDLPFAFITGTTLVSTVHYFLSYVFHFILIRTNINPLLFSNIVVFTLFIFIFSLFLIKKTKEQTSPNEVFSNVFTSTKSYFKDSTSLYWITLWGFILFAVYLIFYSFFVKNNILHSGYTVFSDFAPHTAVISSFAWGNNFPTQYPHFAGDGISYHFFFFYLCANLLFLGFRFDLAMNIPSIIGILSFTTLLGSLGVLLTKRKFVFFLSPFMLFFRSSYAIFDYLKELIAKQGSTFSTVIKDIFSTDKFIGNTIHDDWGLWAMNVYANQRHFLWGISILLIIIFIMYPTIRKPLFPISNLTFKEKIKSYFINPNFWKIHHLRNLILVLLLIACLPFWHGSVLISTLLILFIMVFFARERFSYLAIAVTGVASSFILTSFFSGGAGNVITPKFLFGFISPDKSFFGVLLYLFKVLGIAFIFSLIIPFFYKRRDKVIFSISSLSLLVFAITFSLTLDATVNHKYIILSVALLNIFIADIYLSLWDKIKNIKTFGPAISFFGVLLALLIGFSLFATGFVELMGYKNKNKNTVTINLDSSLIHWLKTNTNTDDIFLTAPYDMNTFFFSGRKIFYGWPYYTMTTGHNINERLEIVRNLFSGCGGDVEIFKKIADEYNIRYVVIDENLLNATDYVIDTRFFEINTEEVVSFPDIKNTTIYRIKE